MDDGWIARRGSDFISVIDLDIANLPDELLELLDGTQDSVDPARSTGELYDQCPCVFVDHSMMQVLSPAAAKKAPTTTG